jgi:hypothetical protein
VRSSRESSMRSRSDRGVSVAFTIELCSRQLWGDPLDHLFARNPRHRSNRGRIGSMRSYGQSRSFGKRAFRMVSPVLVAGGSGFSDGAVFPDGAGTVVRRASARSAT